MVGKEKAELSKEHQEQRMNAIHKQQKEYYDSLEKKGNKNDLADLIEDKLWEFRERYSDEIYSTKNFTHEDYNVVEYNTYPKVCFTYADIKERGKNRMEAIKSLNEEKTNTAAQRPTENGSALNGGSVFNFNQEKKSKSEKSEVDLLSEMFEELNSIAEEETKKAFEKGLNDYYNDLLKEATQKLNKETDEFIDYLSFGAFAKSEKSEGELWEDFIKSINLDEIRREQTQTTEYDGKSTPSYYIGKYKQITAADVVADFGLSYNVGNSVVYCLRSGKKPDNAYIQDLKKAVHHLNMEIEQIERK